MNQTTSNQRTRRWLLTAVLIGLPHACLAQTVLFSDNFSIPDGLITNEYAYWNPTDPTAVKSPNWEMTSGSVFANGSSGWTGIPDTIGPNATSSNGTNSAVFRMTSQRADFGDVAVSFSLFNLGLSTTSTTPAVAWDGLHIFLRYQSEYNLYYASINRRDNTAVIKKKVPGGVSNGGTYYDMSSYVSHTVPYNTWQNVKATVQNNPDGSVTIKLYAEGVLLVSAVDNGSVGGAPITLPGKVGLRGDNANLKFDDFTVTSLSSSTPDTTAPVLSNIAASGVTASAATIGWTTNEPADTQVEYGLTTSYGQSTALNSTLATSHGTGLSGLSSSTSYHFRVKSRDAAGNLAVSGDFTFATAAAAASTADTLSPMITILSPSSGSTIKKSINCSLTGSDNVGVTRIELWGDGALVASKDFSPAASSFNNTLSWYAPKGQRTVQAKAYDAAGNVGTSGSIILNVTRTSTLVALTSDSTLSAGGDGSEPRALVLSLQAGRTQTLVFSPEVQEASILSIRGRVLRHEVQQGGPIAMFLQGAGDQRIGMESGLWLIQMRDGDGHSSIKPLVVVK